MNTAAGAGCAGAAHTAHAESDSHVSLFLGLEQKNKKHFMIGRETALCTSLIPQIDIWGRRMLLWQALRRSAGEMFKYDQKMSTLSNVVFRNSVSDTTPIRDDAQQISQRIPSGSEFRAVKST